MAVPDLFGMAKIAGAAQRRNSACQRRPVQPPPVSLRRDDWEAAMRATATDSFSIPWQTYSPDEHLLARAGELARQKYSQIGYNQKR